MTREFLDYLERYRLHLNEAWAQRLKAEQDLSKVQVFHTEVRAQDQVIREIFELEAEDINDTSRG